MFSILKNITVFATLVLALVRCTSSPVEITPSPNPTRATDTVKVQATTVTSEIPETQTPVCRQITPPDSRFQDGLLFYEYDSSNPPGTSRIWLWSKSMPSPQLVLEITSRIDFHLSFDGTKLAWHESEADYFNIYNLNSGENKNYPWQDSWQAINGWTKEGKVAILVGQITTYDLGKTSTYAYFDGATQSINTENVILDLPGYTQDQLSRDPQDGFAITDPTQTLVFYTSNEGEFGKLILLEIKSGQRLWEETAQYPFYPYPDWTSSGDFVAFALPSNNRAVIYTLTRDGETIDVVGEGLPNGLVRDLRWSLNEKYIYYAYWITINEGPAYIIDLDTKETEEVCAADRMFLRGFWLSDSQFAYVVQEGIQPNQPGVGELRILDVETWNFTTVFKMSRKMETPFDLSVLGMTPVTEP